LSALEGVQDVTSLPLWVINEARKAPHLFTAIDRTAQTLLQRGRNPLRRHPVLEMLGGALDFAEHKQRLGDRGLGGAAMAEIEPKIDVRESIGGEPKREK
jgi:hypothetical protein